MFKLLNRICLTNNHWCLKYLSVQINRSIPVWINLYITKRIDWMLDTLEIYSRSQTAELLWQEILLSDLPQSGQISGYNRWIFSYDINSTSIVEHYCMKEVCIRDVLNISTVYLHQVHSSFTSTYVEKNLVEIISYLPRFFVKIWTVSTYEKLKIQVRACMCVNVYLCMSGCMHVFMYVCMHCPTECTYTHILQL